MYLRAIHAEFEIPALRRFIRENALGLLITGLPSTNFPTLQCTHIPWVLDVSDEDSQTELGTLRGHLARQNPHSKAMAEAVLRSSDSSSNGVLEHEVSVVFTGPVHSYVTPKFYTETKPATGKVVPTWNYSAVQAYGRATVFCDPKSTTTEAFLSKQIVDLTKHAESSISNHTGADGRPKPWEVSDAPDSFINILQKSIIGIEITIDRLEGKHKMTQEMSKGDRDGVIAGFEGLNTEAGSLMAKIVRERGAMKDAAKDAAKTAAQGAE
ncbi:putative FMN-binding domain-containing protein [Triangularia verruculosa]|uniref:FMN-binding domain-containing protein n=1 Tax=Triangularia verruculosa TaxID=2587418 RepID=A0AAN7ARH9_9PEZI|nr:putative FMN-binding domain-containing protein [Triangularia verruculosa]